MVEQLVITTDDVEFDEDRNGIDQNINQDRNRPNL